MKTTVAKGLGGRRAVRASGEAPLTVRRGTLPPAEENEEVIANPHVDVLWRELMASEESLRSRPVGEVLYASSLMSPEISRALWDWVTFLNAGWKITAMTETDEPDADAVAYLNEFIERLATHYGSMDALINRGIISLLLRGALFCELVLAPDYTPADLVFVDPALASFRWVSDPVRGQRWQLGQLDENDFVPLERETIVYMPLHADFSPHGRAPFLSAIYPALFITTMLRDVRRVLSQQGYPRLTLSVDLEKLMLSVPDMDRDDPAKIEQWVASVMDEITAVYENLQPDDAFITTDVVSVGSISPVSTEALGTIDRIIVALERFATRGLKSMPIMMATTETTTESHAKRQWEVFVAYVSSIQHGVESVLERLLSLALRAAGSRSVAEFRFAKIRATEELTDEQTRAQRLQTLEKLLALGVISREELALELVGHPPALSDEDWLDSPLRGAAETPDATPTFTAEPGGETEGGRALTPMDLGRALEALWNGRPYP